MTRIEMPLAGDVIALGQGERQPRAATSSGSNPTIACQQKVNDHMAIAQGTANTSLCGHPDAERNRSPDYLLFYRVSFDYGDQMRRKIGRDLGRKATDADLTSIGTWMKIDEVE